MSSVAKGGIVAPVSIVDGEVVSDAAVSNVAALDFDSLSNRHHHSLDVLISDLDICLA